MNNNGMNNFNEEQKVAVLTVLKWIGLWASMDIADTETLLPKFDERLKLNYQLLNFNQKSTLLTKYENEESEDILFAALNTIPTSTKPWFVVETYMMVSANGNITPRAMQITLMYCEKIGIPEDMYLNIIKQAYGATGDYEEGMFDI
jgi:hypothetical protein